MINRFNKAEEVRSYTKRLPPLAPVPLRWILRAI